MLLACSEKIPALGLFQVLLNALAVFIERGEIVLPVAVAVLSGAPRPAERLGEILFHAEPAVVEVPNLTFGERISLFRKLQMAGEALVVLLGVPVFFDQLVAAVQLRAGLIIT